jgi:4-hydroxybenzoate polyprenyltransferase
MKIIVPAVQAAAPQDDWAPADIKSVSSLPARQSHDTRLVGDILLLCRPWHWVKNVFVLLPLLFSLSFVNPVKALGATAAFACFCLLSSGVYAINDVLDAASDRQHPRKRCRPVASERVRTTTALVLGLTLIGSAVFLGLMTLPRAFTITTILYAGNSLLYCLLLKHRVIVDVIAISLGFVLRLLGGCTAIGVEPSAWLLICGFNLALLLGFGKRRTEVVNLKAGVDSRPVLVSYDAPKLDVVLSISCSCCLMSYLLYTVAPETVATHGTNRLLYTVPFVVYGLFRYIFKVQEGRGDGPVEIILMDRWLIVDGVLWMSSAALILLLR